MKVLMATMQLDIGGAETHIVELSKALTRKGVEVFVASRGGAYTEELEVAGIRHFNVPLNRKTVCSLRRAYKALERIIIENKIDIVHAHARIPGFLCGLLSKKHNLRFVTTAHWVFTTRFPFNLLTNWGDRSLAVSDDIKKYLIDNYGCLAENIRVTINGVDIDKFSDAVDYSDIATEFGFGENRTRVVYVSRMDIDRSLAAHKLIEAVPKLYSVHPRLEVVIVGGGNDFEKIQSEAEQINKALGARVVITTGSRTDVNKFAASGEVFVGVSRAALEAMACKRPAIIAGNEGYIGIFDEDKLNISIATNFCCRGCEDTTTERLCKDLLMLLGDDKAELRKRLGEYSLETVKKYYSVDTMANDALMMYSSIAKEKPINEITEMDIEDTERYLVCGSGRRTVDAVVSGYYGFYNSGDDSILAAMVKDLKKACPNISINVLSQSPKETARIYDVNSTDRRNLFKIFSLLKRTKLLISGGGSLIQDITSSKSLYYYLLLIRMAKLMGAKVMLYANGIGPITKKKNVKHIQKVLNKVDYITLRENSSMEELRLISAGKDVARCIVTADPVFTAEIVEGEIIESVLSISGVSNEDKFFVVSVRDWPRLDDEFEEKLCEFCKYIYNSYGIKPLIVPMQGRFDRRISESIFKSLDIPCGFLEKECGPEVMMGVINRAEFVLGMRLHTLLYAVKTGVPMIALEYDPKVAAIMKSMNMEYSESVENIDTSRLCKFASEIIENREDLSHSIIEKSLEFSVLAKENTRVAVELIKNQEYR